MTLINQSVSVNAFYFAGTREMRSFPRSIEFGSTSCTFKDGMQYLVRQGHHVVRLFDMTDGDKIYRLRNENDAWTLIGTRPN
jgi:hypothetical protein